MGVGFPHSAGGYRPGDTTVYVTRLLDFVYCVPSDFTGTIQSNGTIEPAL